MAATTSLTSAQFNTLFCDLLDLRGHLAKTGTDKHNQVDLLINACIAGGIDLGPQIVGVLVKLGFDRKHAGIRLKAGIRYEPEWPNWGRRSDGTYHAPSAPPADH